MKKHQYKTKLLEFGNDEKQIKILDCIYALSNNIVEPGDIIVDNYQRIKVEKMKVARLIHDDYPELIYYGYRVNRSGNIIDPITYTSTWQRFIKEVEKKSKNNYNKKVCL